MGMNFNDFTALYRNSQEKQVEINGNTIRAYPSDFGPGCNFENGVEFEALVVKSLSPSATNAIHISFSPGAYNDITFSTTNDYIIARMENPDATTGLATGNDGYSISGNTLTVNSVGGVGDRFPTLQACVLEIEAGTAGVPVPTADNNVWLFIDKNTTEETVTLTNSYLSVEIICGDRTITIIEDF